eukprot:PhF_6_TR27781/c0_g1_i1/m.40464
MNVKGITYLGYVYHVFLFASAVSIIAQYFDHIAPLVISSVSLGFLLCSLICRCFSKSDLIITIFEFLTLLTLGSIVLAVPNDSEESCEWLLWSSAVIASVFLPFPAVFSSWIGLCIIFGFYNAETCGFFIASIGTFGISRYSTLIHKQNKTNHKGTEGGGLRLRSLSLQMSQFAANDSTNHLDGSQKSPHQDPSSEDGLLTLYPIPMRRPRNSVLLPEVSQGTPEGPHELSDSIQQRSSGSRKQSTVPSQLSLLDSPRANSLISLGTSTHSSRQNSHRDHFVSTVSDELRTPVSALFGLIDVMKVDERERESYSNWCTLTSVADALLLLVENLIDVAKVSVDAKSLVPASSPCDVEQMIKRVVETFNVQMLTRSVCIVPTLDCRVCGPGAVLSDKSRICQILFNVLQEFTRSDIHDTTLFLDVRPDPAMKLSMIMTADNQDLPYLDFLRRNMSGKPVNRMNVTVAVAAIRSSGGDISITNGKSLQITYHCVVVADEPPAPVKGAFAYICKEGIPNSYMSLMSYCTQLAVPFQIVNKSVDVATHACIKPPPPRCKIIIFTSKPDVPESLARGYLYAVVAEDHAYGTLGKISFDDKIRELPYPMFPNDIITYLHRVVDESVGTPQEHSLEIQLKRSVTESDPLVVYDLHIMLVEDNNVISRVSQRKLQKEFATVTTIGSGEQALKEFTTHPEKTYHVILMDVELPGISGLETTRRIRNWEVEKEWDAVFIIAVTANAAGADAEACIESGMNDYMCKPFSNEKLTQILKGRKLI